MRLVLWQRSGLSRGRSRFGKGGKNKYEIRIPACQSLLRRTGRNTKLEASLRIESLRQYQNPNDINSKHQDVNLFVLII